MVSHFKIRLLSTLIVVFFGFQLSFANTEKVSGIQKNNNSGVFVTEKEFDSENEAASSHQSEIKLAGEEVTVKFSNKEKVTLKAGNKIVFKPGTKITAGSEVHASIMQQTTDSEAEKNSTQQLLDIVKKHNEKVQKEINRNNEKGKAKVKQGKLGRQLLFLLNTYEQLCRTKDKARDVLDNEGKKRSLIITASQIQGISSEQNNRIQAVKDETIRSLPINHIIKTHFQPVTCRYNPEVSMVLRL